MILHLKHNEIDRQRWDSAIGHSVQQVPYACSWWLDIVCPQWEALVQDDYSALFPLPLNRKFGLPYLAQPVLTQQLGLFSCDKHHDDDVIRNFTKAIPYFCYNLHLNEQNKITPSGLSSASDRTNLLLPLDRPCDETEKLFNSNTRRNINKAIKSGVTVTQCTDAPLFTDFYVRTNRHNTVPHDTILRLLTECLNRDKADILMARHDNDIVAMLFLLKNKGRLTYLMPASTPLGMQTSAMFAIVSHIITVCSQKYDTLDFEGSMIDGVARFYRGFGATEVPYAHIWRGRPAWLNKTYKLLTGKK